VQREVGGLEGKRTQAANGMIDPEGQHRERAAAEEVEVR